MNPATALLYSAEAVWMGAFVYLLDRFYPLEVPLGRLVELYNEDPIELFDIIKPLVEGKVGRVHDVRLYRGFVSRASGSAIVEYMVEVDEGEVGVKLIYAEDPGKALMEYYEGEKEGV